MLLSPDCPGGGTVGLDWEKPNSDKTSRSHRTSHPVEVEATVSASLVDNDTVVCCLDVYDMRPACWSRTAQPEIERRVSGSQAQSESENADRAGLGLELLLYIRP